MFQISKLNIGTGAGTSAGGMSSRRRVFKRRAKWQAKIKKLRHARQERLEEKEEREDFLKFCGERTSDDDEESEIDDDPDFMDISSTSEVSEDQKQN